jgi:predicted Zn-dependent protease
MVNHFRDQGAVARFSEGSKKASCDVHVRLTGCGIAIDLPGDEMLNWPFGGLSVAEPLSQDSIDALVRSSSQPGASLFVPDKIFARALAEHAPHLSVRAHRVRAAKPWIWAAGVAGVVAAGSWAAGLSPANAIARMLPLSARQMLGDQVLASMTGDRRVCTAPRGLEALDALTSKLSKAAGTAQEFKIVVVDWDVLNAFATPGERIVLTRALIEKAESPDEVAGVLAHEMGHGIELHPETGIVRGLGLSAATELMLGGAGGLANIGLLLTQLSYSRDAERQADGHALSILKSARISPGGLLAFFDRVIETEEKEGDGTPAVLRSHPQTDERRGRVMATAPYPADPALDGKSWAALKAVCSVTTGTEPQSVEPPEEQPAPRPLGPGEIDG